MSTRRWPLAFLALIALAALGLAACTETNNPPPGTQARQIAVSGQGEVSAQPDTVILNLGVSVLRDTVAAAIADSAAAMTGVLNVLNEQGVDEDDIQTTNFSIFPEYDFRENDRQLRGFRVNNQVVTRLHDVDAAGQLIDAAAEAGGDDVVINGISFTIDDRDALLDEARELAVEDARRKAEQLADLAGVDLGDVIAIAESGVGIPPPIPIARSFDAVAEAAPTPIAPGESTIFVGVSIVFELN